MARLFPDGRLDWYTCLGGSGGDEGRGIAGDDSGHVYVTGRSEDYAWSDAGTLVGTHSDSYDAFVVKLDAATGVIAWHTFLGGSGSDGGEGIAVDAAGNIWVTGFCDADWGTDPVRDYSGSSDAFAAKLEDNGDLVWHTFLGSDDGGEYGYGIAVDDEGNSYVSGFSGLTWSDPLDPTPVRPNSGDTDGFAAALDSSGALSWYTFLGGTGDDCFEYYAPHCGIAADGNGNVYVGGYSSNSWGNPLRTYSGGRDGFAVKLAADTGDLIWNTFLGGTGQDRTGGPIALDDDGNIYLAGYSYGQLGQPGTGVCGWRGLLRREARRRW